MAPLQMQIFLLGEMQMQKNIGGLKGLNLSVIWLSANLRTNTKQFLLDYSLSKNHNHKPLVDNQDDAFSCHELQWPSYNR